MKPIQIVADDREARSELFRMLEELDGAAVRVARLPLGDYVVANRLLVERKTLVDLTVSIKDGRLFRQAYRLASSSLHPVVLLEGTAGDLAGSSMRREAIQGALIHLTIGLGIPLLRSKTASESARLMCYAGRQIQRRRSGALPRLSGRKRPTGKRKTQLHILQGLPGIGPARASRMLDAFGSVERIFTASADELERVPGVGPRTARAVRWAVREQTTPYAASGSSASAFS